MKLRTFSGLVALSILGVLGLSSQACTETTLDPRATDAGADADAAPEGDAVAPPDAGHDAGPSDHPLAGYTIVASSDDPRTGTALAMTLDAHDDPLLAYLSYTPGSDAAALVFVQWDAKEKRFSGPFVVDADGVGAVDTSHGGRPISIAYDASQNRVAIAYEKVLGDANAVTTVWLASATLAKQKTGFVAAPAFTVAQVSEVGNAAASPAADPAVGVSGGKTFVAYAQKNWQCCPPESPTCSACNGLWMLESMAAPAADAGADAATPDAEASDGASADAADANDAAPDATLSSDAVDGGAGDPSDASDDAAPDASGDASNDASDGASPPAPLLFTRHLMRYGGAPARVRFDAPIGMAVDSTGSPGIAFFAMPSSGQGTQVFFWQRGMSEAIIARDTVSAANDVVDLSLVFDGTMPRLVTALADDATPASDVQFNASTDGARWGSASPIVPEGRPRATRAAAIALAGGTVAVAAHTECARPGTCDNLYVATSTNGNDWTPQPTPGRYAASALNIALGKTDAPGALMVAFHSDGRINGISRPPTPPKDAVVFWRK